MDLPLGPRRPEAVRELEALQQDERAGAGEPELTPELFLQKFRENVESDIVASRIHKVGDQISVDPFGDTGKEAEAQCEAMMQAWRLADESQWSRYELPSIRYDIARICSEVETVFAAEKWPLAEFPVVGTLTTGRESATTQPTASGAPLILIDNGFFKFAAIMARLAIFAPYDAQHRGSFSEATVQLLTDFVATHTILNTCLYAYPRAVPPEFREAADKLTYAIGVFVIAHEYAHISNGDYQAHPARPGGPDASRHEKELQADRMGFSATVEALKAKDAAPAGVFAAFLYLVGLDIIYRAKAVYETRPPPLADPVYPTPYERVVALLDWLGSSATGEALLTNIREASACYHTILFVWDQIAPAFAAARDELAAFDPAKAPPDAPPVLDEARVFGLVQTLWRRVQPTVGAPALPPELTAPRKPR